MPRRSNSPTRSGRRGKLQPRGCRASSTAPCKRSCEKRRRCSPDQLAQVATTGAQRLEQRQAQVGAGIERQRAEAMEAFEARLVQAEQELRRRLDTLSADTEAERAVLEARLRELAKRIEEAMART